MVVAVAAVIALFTFLLGYRLGWNDGRFFERVNR